MRKLLLSLSIGLGGLFLLISVWVFQQEAEKLAILRAQPPIKVEIVQVVCKRKKFFIRFYWKGNVLYESLPHHYPTCEKLKKEDTIEIKVGANGKIIFADETYNGSLEKEIYLREQAINKVPEDVALVCSYSKPAPIHRRRKKRSYPFG